MSGYPTSTNIPRVDGLSTDTPVLGRHISHLAYACVRESVRTRDWVMIGRILFMTCRHSGV